MSDSLHQKNSVSMQEPVTQGSSELPVGAKGGEAVRPASRSALIVRVFVFLIVLAALVALSFYAAEWKKKVLVRGFIVDGAMIVSDRELLSCMSAFKGSNLEKLDTRELKRRIMALPYLQDVEISKELNGIVRVKVFEREPVAEAVLDGRIMAIDVEGFLLPEKGSLAERFPDLLKIKGVIRIHKAKNGLLKLDRYDVEFIRRFLAALSESDYAKLLIRELHLAPNNMSWCMAVQTPTRFIVGNDGNFKEKLKKFEIFWKKVVSKKGFDSYDVVDLRFRDRIFTRVPVSPEAPLDVPL